MTDYEKGKLDAEIRLLETRLTDAITLIPCRYFGVNCLECEFEYEDNCQNMFAAKKLEELKKEREE